MDKLNIVDNRTPEQLVRENCDRWEDGSEYCPPQFTGEARERFLEEVRQERIKQNAASI